MSKAEWKQETERQTLNRKPGNIGDARKAWRALDTEQKFEIIDEVVGTRSAEFCRAYRNVIEVVSGNKVSSRKVRSKANPEGIEKRVVKNQPCIIFLVKSKWKADDSRASEAQILPKEVWAYASILKKHKGKVELVRQLCLVPTDVDLSEVMQGEAQRYVTVQTPGPISDENGNVACLVKYSVTGSPQVWHGFLSCRHVFSVTRAYHPIPKRKLKVAGGSQWSADATFAKTSGHFGRLSKSSQKCHDAQIARVSSLDIATNQLKKLFFPQGYARGFAQIPKASYCYIHTPRGVIRMRYHTHYRNRRIVAYKTPSNGRFDAVHPILFAFSAQSSTEGGDSGSPVTTMRSGGRFLGMHIGGNSTHQISFVIPAWELFNSSNYSGLRKMKLVARW